MGVHTVFIGEGEKLVDVGADAEAPLGASEDADSAAARGVVLREVGHRLGARERGRVTMSGRDEKCRWEMSLKKWNKNEVKM